LSHFGHPKTNDEPIFVVAMSPEVEAKFNNIRLDLPSHSIFPHSTMTFPSIIIMKKTKIRLAITDWPVEWIARLKYIL